MFLRKDNAWPTRKGSECEHKASTERSGLFSACKCPPDTCGRQDNTLACPEMRLTRIKSLDRKVQAFSVCMSQMDTHRLLHNTCYLTDIFRAIFRLALDKESTNSCSTDHTSQDNHGDPPLVGGLFFFLCSGVRLRKFYNRTVYRGFKLNF